MKHPIEYYKYNGYEILFYILLVVFIVILAVKYDFIQTLINVLT